MKKLKVIVVGAGMAGLVAAIALRQSGFSVKVYEKTAHLTNIGGGFLIYPHGIHILKLLGLQSIVDQLTATLNHYYVYDASDGLLMSESLAAFYRETDHFIQAMGRTDLQKLLVNALPLDTIYFQHRCIKVVEHVDKVSVHFTNDVEDQADLIIGADGIHSTVRESIVPNVESSYRGICFWGGILDPVYTVNICDRALVFIFGNNKLCWVAPLSGKRQMWYLSHRMPETDLSQNKDKTAQLKSLFSSWNKWVDEIIKVPSNEYNFALPVMEIKPLDQWVSHRIALIGDAAHAFGPVIGQGYSAAMEDAYILTACIQHHTHDLSAALQRYQSIRQPITNQLQQLENLNQNVKISDELKTIHERNHAYQTQTPQQILKPITQLINPLSFNQQLEASC